MKLRTDERDLLLALAQEAPAAASNKHTQYLLRKFGLIGWLKEGKLTVKGLHVARKFAGFVGVVPAETTVQIDPNMTMAGPPGWKPSERKRKRKPKTE